ncbi:GNAT family N-acetyltransferase [Hymenobacter busanensis]|uniref:GNAT family N-acetyltransferase n=1 Tax=Hymenobacter busanensis TaxID=2607656 RepID=A0A7L4ZWN5_9BACT|nr:GNAT family N-acetyltransferase [Hymenobacter busanensis]KAA9332387.1 GNAT family N-acetyltransferase [Hymenobacter busanensis]QHJ07276.1 GNAT family N-acetyltransferase [Hymenobacter busanensis]
MTLSAPVEVSRVSIRAAVETDAAALAGLVAEVGYPTEEATLRTRLADLTAAGDLLLVAEYAGRVVGFAHLHRTPFLHRAPDGRIVTLAVTADLRSQGLGKQLLQAAEQVFRQWGCGRIEVTSGKPREAAHRFYLREGYEEQSKRFVKLLPG